MYTRGKKWKKVYEYKQYEKRERVTWATYEKKSVFLVCCVTEPVFMWS